MRRRRQESFLESVWPPLADIMTLVACVFLVVFIASMVAYRTAEANRNKAIKEQAKLAQELKKAIEQTKKRDAKRKNIFKDLLGKISEEQDGGKMLGEQGIEIELNGAIKLPEKALFRRGLAKLEPRGEQLIKTVVAELIERALNEPGTRVLIAGHTDNIPISTPRFPSNWELSTGRATNVLRAVLDVKPNLPSGRAFAAGFADTQPLPEIEHDDGRNRRVEIHILTDGTEALENLEVGEDG